MEVEVKGWVEVEKAPAVVGRACVELVRAMVLAGRALAVVVTAPEVEQMVMEGATKAWAGVPRGLVVVAMVPEEARMGVAVVRTAAVEVMVGVGAAVAVVAMVVALMVGAKAMNAEATAAIGVAQKASAAASVVWVTMARDT